jgi:hypothetical protein
VPHIDGLVLVAALAWLVGFGAAAGWLALRHRRNAAVWAALGAVLGPVALVIVSVAPPGRCWSCATPTRGWLTICGWCGEDVRGPHQPEPAPTRAASLTVIDGAGGGSASAATTRRRQRSKRKDVVAPASSGADPGPQAPAAPAGGLARPARVQRLQSARGNGSISAATVAAERLERESIAHAAQEPREFAVASAIYVTGSKGLLAGGRYRIAILSDVLQILGPVHVDPWAVAFERTLEGVEAIASQDRLVITAQGRAPLTLVFMSVAGGTPERVADLIATAAAGAAGEGS